MRLAARWLLTDYFKTYNKLDFYTMASPDLQAKANALNARMEGEAKIAIDEVERTLLRTIARQSYVCVVNCYDKAGKSGPSEQLERCSRECQTPNQMAHNTVQQVR